MDTNTSGQGKNATVPAEIDRWNWGAFLLNWIWGIGNHTFIALLMFTIASALKTSEPYNMAVNRLQGNPQVLAMVGLPMVTGAPTGNMAVSGPSGHASLSFSVEGPKGKGQAYVEAVKELGRGI